MITPEIAKACVEALPHVLPRFATRGAKKGIAHLQYGYRFSLRHRDICIATRATSSGITVYVNQTSLSNRRFPQADFPPGTVTEKYARNSVGKTGDKGLSTAAASLPSIDPALNDSMRLSFSEVRHFERLLAWYFDVTPAAQLSSAPAPAPASELVAASATTPGFSASLADDAIVRTLTPTERKAWLKVRYGQGKFRELLIANAGPQCWMTGIQGRALLVASHIQPWAHCDTNPHDRLSTDNGLLLSALWDAAFDAGLVTFDSHWRAVASAQLSASARRELGLDQPLHLPERYRNTRRQQFMAYHREHVFQR